MEPSREWTEIGEVASLVAQLEWLIMDHIRLATTSVDAIGLHVQPTGAIGRVLERLVPDCALSASGQSSTWGTGELARGWLVLVDGASLQYLADPTSGRHKEVFERMLAVLFEAAVSSREAGDDVVRAPSTISG